MTKEDDLSRLCHRGWRGGKMVLISDYEVMRRDSVGELKLHGSRRRGVRHASQVCSLCVQSPGTHYRVHGQGYLREEGEENETGVIWH